MEDDRNKNLLIAQQYKMRFYENEYPVEGELVLVATTLRRGNPRSPKRTAATWLSSSTTTRSA